MVSDGSPAQSRAIQITTRVAVARLLAEGMSRNEVARRLGIARSTVSYHARRLGESVDERCARRYDWSGVQAFYDEGHSVRECQTVFGFSRQSWHEAVRRGRLAPRPHATPMADLFAEDVPRGRRNLKRRLLAAGIKIGCCEVCGISSWHGRALSLALHHVNGNRYDNRVENLQLLCPNCHSQTENFGGRQPGRTR